MTYDVPTPISLKTKESEVVHVITKPAVGQRVLVFDPAQSEVAVSRAVHLTNTTGLCLAPGRVAVFEAGRIVGHAPFPPMLPGDDELLMIGLDDSVSIARSMATSSTATKVALLKRSSAGGQEPAEGKEEGAAGRVVDGVEVTRRLTRSTTYAITNHDGEHRVPHLYVYHMAHAAYEGYVITTDEHCIRAMPS